MKLHSRQYFSGPNIGASFRAVRWVLEDALLPLPDAGEIDTRTRNLFTSVTGTHPEIGNATSTSLAVLALKYALALQRAHHHPVSKARLHPLGHKRCELVIEVAKAGIATALRDCTFALIDEVCGSAEPGTFAHVREKHAQRLRFGLTHTYLHDRQKVARRLGVPAWYEGARRFMFFGDGCYARLTSGGHTDKTSVLSTQLEHDKARASRRLAACGLPAAPQKLVSDAESAVSAAHLIGFPVVLKPRWGKQGQGVAVNLGSDNQVRAAYAAAREFNRDVVVERFLAGDSYRLLSINGRFVAAVKTLQPQVCGDGTRSLQTLIDAANRNERRDGVLLNPIDIDAELLHSLEARGLGLDTIPGAGEIVVLRGTANQAIGGTTIDVTDDVHPDNQEMAAAAAHACMLDIAGLDFVTTDIGRSWRDGVGGIVEVNGGPAFDLHMLPTVGKPRDVSWHLIRAVRPASSPGTVPRFMVAGRYGKKSVAARLVELLSCVGFTPGLLAKKEVTVKDTTSEFDDVDDAAEAVFTRPDVDAVVVEQSLGALCESGSLVERYAVAVLTDAGGDTTALEVALGDSTAGEQVVELAVWLASVVVIDAAYADLHARVAELPPQQKGYIWVAKADSEQVDAHVAAGGWAVVRAQRDGTGWLEWRQNEQRVALMPIMEDGEAQIRDDAFAAAALIGAGHRPEAVAAVLGGDQTNMIQPVWPADELESVFVGAWINRPGPGLHLGKVVLGVDAVVPGSVSVIAGPPDDLAACAQLEAEVRDAFARGASAVIAPLVPDDLPRWRPVLVCDDPAAGYARLTAGVAEAVVSLD
ncbi:MAG: acetate--CoA ligase family protein [Pseudomonadota bacterium]